MKVFSIIIIVLGIILRYWINRRRFYRRNAFGTQAFSSYKKAKLTSVFEGLLIFLGTALIIAGIILFSTTFISVHRGH